MSVQSDDAREETEIALYKAITAKVGEVNDGPLAVQITRLKELSEAFAAVTFGSRP